MFGPILSVLLMGTVPVWGIQGDQAPLPQSIRIAPPASTGSVQAGVLRASLTASGAIIVDLKSGQTVFERDAETSRPMASLTKLMTALIIAEHHDLSELVTIPADIKNVVGTIASLPPGEQFAVGDLLSASLIMSANDAAITLARYHSGTVEAFAMEMNERAKQLGLTKTSYQNPVGLDAPSQESSPQNLAWLAMYVMRNPEIAKRMGTANIQISSLAGNIISLTHTHQLLQAEDREVLAGKTGTTDAAGQCLLTILEVNGRTYVVVLLHSKDRYADMRAVLAALTNE